jgi:hypothetical protein
MEDERPGNRGLSVKILPDPAPEILLPKGVRMVGHTGSAYGLISNFFFDPGKKFGYVYMMNGSFSEPKLGPPALFYDFEEALIKALTENSAMPCK